MKKKVLVTYRLPFEGFTQISETNEFELIFPKKDSFSEEEILERIEGIDVLLSMFNFKVGARIMDHANQLKLISNYGVGFNNIDIKYAKSKGITVTNTPDPVVEPTAELAFALMGDLARKISECDRKMREPNNIKWGVLENLGIGLYGKTLGIIGMGRIGQSLAKRALASGMKICYHNRHQLDRETEIAYHARYVILDDLLTESDYISINTPLTDDTYHLLDRKTFAKMKSHAMIINTSRGPVINELDLATAIQSEQIGGAALDVYEFEPEVSKELLSLDNIVLVPHIGTATISARNAMSEYACENIIRFFKGEDPLSRVV